MVNHLTARLALSLSCRKEETRTPDPYVPNVVRYQLRYFPNTAAKILKSSLRTEEKGFFLI